MNLTCIPIIVILCFIMNKVLIVVLRKSKNITLLLLVINALIGGCFAFLIYKFVPNYINVDNFLDAIFIGILSGISSLGTNSIMKNVFKKKK